MYQKLPKMTTNELNQDRESLPPSANKIIITKEVQNAIDRVLKTDDPMDSPNFKTVEYINQMFPNEQSLASIDDIITKMQFECTVIDDNIRGVVRGQTNTGQDGRIALNEAQKVINSLYTQIIDVKTRAEKTEEMVKEITRDIKQLDCAKKNLTSAITTLNHLHMLVGGIDCLNKLIEKRLYGEILNPLQAISEVNHHFQQYSNIQEIRNLSQSVDQIQVVLANQITEDFKESFSPTQKSSNPSSNRLPLSQLADACKVVSVLDSRVKKDLFNWFIQQQLEEYSHLFHENQDIAWLDKIDKRYAWLKRHLLDFEQKFGAIFPVDWEISERITVQFCQMTRDDISSIMAKRINEIDVRLLLFAINKTQAFEQLLSKRFTGITLTGHTVTDSDGNSQQQQQGVFRDIIGVCFKAHLNVYINSIDRNLAELMERFVEMSKEPLRMAESKTTVFPSSGDLFVFYKKCMVQCTQLSNEQPMYDLAMIFKKYLREYNTKVLEANTPKMQNIQNSIGNSMSLLTKDFQNLSTAAGQVFYNFLKEGESQRFTKNDLIRICCILTTAEYCLETIQQLEDKLKDKVTAAYVNKIDMSEEKDIFHRTISNCIQLLVQDLENGCETSLTVMSKVQWQNISNVGDQSPFINTIIGHFKQSIPVIRDNLSTSRKYFTQFLHKFVSSFIPKFVNTLYKCRPTNSDGSNNILGCEQLLLDTHSLKTVLLDLPSIGSSVNRKAPTSYTKVVIKDMSRAEMIIKIVMTQVQPAAAFTAQVLKLLPDISIAEYQKILDMKSVKRLDQMQLIEMYKRVAPTAAIPLPSSGTTTIVSNSTDELNEANKGNAMEEMTNTSGGQQQQDAGYVPTQSGTPNKRSFLFGGFSSSSNSDKNLDSTSQTPGASANTQTPTSVERGRIRKLESLLKKRLP